MIKKILIGVGVVAVAFLGFVLTRPATYHVERTVTIAAPIDVVFGLVNDMPKRAAWYPWDRLDPEMKRTYSPQTVGVGASYEWAGNDKVGTGRQEILESVPNQKIVDDLHFKEPFESRSKASFTFVDKGGSTEVTWAIDGGDGFSTRMMNTFMSMDDAIGKDFENGLKFLDEAARAAAQAATARAAAEAPAADPEAPAAEGEPAGEEAAEATDG